MYVFKPNIALAGKATPPPPLSRFQWFFHKLYVNYHIAPSTSLHIQESSEAWVWYAEAFTLLPPPLSKNEERNASCNICKFYKLTCVQVRLHHVYAVNVGSA